MVRVIYTFILIMLLSPLLALGDQIGSYKPPLDTSGKQYSLRDHNGQCRYTFVDMHFHPTTFIARGDRLTKIAKDARKACVKTIVINVFPVLKTWSKDHKQQPTYYGDDDAKVYWSGTAEQLIFNEYLTLNKKDKAKFVFLLNGFNHSDKNAILMVNKLLTLYRQKKIPIIGFGEIMAKHDKLSDQTQGGSPHINHPALEPIFKLAQKNHWIVLIHNNLGHQAFSGYSKLIYFDSIKEILAKHSETTIILAHAGISRNIVVKDLTGIIDKLLTKYKNLYIDISWVLYTDYIYRNKKVSKKWIALISKYPDRFLIGTDNIGGYKKDFRNIKKYLPLLDTLSPTVANKISHRNAEKLISKALKGPYSH